MVNRSYQTEDELKQELVRFSRWLYRLGFMPGTSGSLSVRFDEERLLTTPTRASKYLLRSTDMVIVDLEGRMADDQEYKFQLMQTDQIAYQRFG